jgi:glycosyltransferase involved in cell wall biosynthesis
MRGGSVSQPRVAIVHDWLDTWRGGENVLAEILAMYPEADLHTLVDFLPEAHRPRLLGRRTRTTFLQRIPGARRRFRVLLPLFPAAIESLDISDYEIVISISHAVAKGVRTHEKQLHICYCLTPMRYAWDLRKAYLASARAEQGLRRLVADCILDRLRRWDAASSNRVNRFIAISDYIAKRIRSCYARDAAVIYPPVDIDFFMPVEAPPAREAYFTASRWVPYKRVDLIVEAFRALPDRRLIVAGDGPDTARVCAAATPNVEFVGEVSRERLRDLMRGAHAFLFAAEEDFGILPVEAQACGTPVIAFGRGGVLETVRGLGTRQPTGVLFGEQSGAAISAAVHEFEMHAREIDSVDCRVNAERFAVSRFRADLGRYVEGAWSEFVSRRR